jgi:hypothetical protein
MVPPPCLGASGCNHYSNDKNQTDSGATEHASSPPNQHNFNKYNAEPGAWYAV